MENCTLSSIILKPKKQRNYLEEIVVKKKEKIKDKIKNVVKELGLVMHGVKDPQKNVKAIQSNKLPYINLVIKKLNRSQKINTDIHRDIVFLTQNNSNVVHSSNPLPKCKGNGNAVLGFEEQWEMYLVDNNVNIEQIRNKTKAIKKYYLLEKLEKFLQN